MLKFHDLYGQSFAHEFQFSNPDSIRNAVKRYNLQRAAEREENKKEKDSNRMNKLRFCKIRNTGQDVQGMVTSRDLDVETQMSLDTRDTSSSSPSASGNNSCCNINDHEIEVETSAAIVERLAGGADTVRPRVKASRGRKQKRGVVKQKMTPVRKLKLNTHDEYAAHIEELHREVCKELQDIAPFELKGNFKKHQSKPRPNKKINQKQPAFKTKSNFKPPATLKHIPPEQTEQDKIMQRLMQVLSVDDQLNAKQMSYEDCGRAQVPWQDITPSPLLPEVMNAQLCRALSTTPSMAYLFMKEHGLPCGTDADPAFVEDSDLEQEFVDRPGYLRFIERLPLNPSEYLETPSSQKPCFVELQPYPHWIRYQRSVKPMHYSSQRSETDTNTLTLCDVQQQEQEQEQLQKEKKPAIERNKSRPMSLGVPTPRKRRLLKHKQLPQEEAAVTNEQLMSRQPGGKEKQELSPLPMATISHHISKRRKNGRNVIFTKSLENLKYEKMAIYNRISLTQERIITSLDRLQGKLLQLQMPTCSNQEKQRMERNAFKFCVKFSRNYLYPLRGLIENVRCTPVASFNSAASNEASQRVVCVYSLMLHSIASYKKQLKYFLLDNVPQKLSALIEMMYTLTNVCLDKGVLDRQDPVVDCLQQRCTSFLTFIEDMQQERFQLARETYRRLQKRAGTGKSGMRERYDLKMFLNDLKLYEPRLVPKERPEKRRQRGWIRRPKRETIPINDQSQQGIQMEPTVENTNVDPVLEVPTHIECVQCGDYRCDPSSDCFEPSSDQKHQLANILALLQQPCREKRELHQQLLEAMEHVTRSHVREVLEPLVHSIGAILDRNMGDHIHYSESHS